MNDWAIVQDQIGALQLALGAPHDLMMLSADTDNVAMQDIYIGLPSRGLLVGFPDFEEVDRGSLPDYMAVLVVRNDEFEKRFPDIFKKCRSRIGSRTREPMQKVKKTKRELADMIAARVGVGGVQIAVYKSPIYGWDANVVTVPSQAINAHAMVQQIAAELREKFDLAE